MKLTVKKRIRKGISKPCPTCRATGMVSAPRSEAERMGLAGNVQLMRTCPDCGGTTVKA